MFDQFYEDKKVVMLKNGELYFQNQVGSPLQKNENTFEDNRIPQFLDLVQNSLALNTYEEKARMARSNTQKKTSADGNPTSYI